MTSLDRDLEFAHRLADAADSVTRPHVGRPTTAKAKADGSPMTPVDLEVERALLDIVARKRAVDGFLGEEVGDVRSGSRRWIVDGIDGTVSFTLGRSEWATLIALEVDGEVVVGVATSPALRRRWWGARDRRAWRSVPAGGTEQLRVSGEAAAPRVEAWVSPWSTRPDDVEMFSRLNGVYPTGGDLPWASPRPRGQRPSWGSGHPGGGLLVAAGLLDGYVMAGGGPWDYAALAVIVEEAGGRFSDLRGRRDIGSASAVFSNGHLHEALLAAITA